MPASKLHEVLASRSRRDFIKTTSAAAGATLAGLYGGPLLAATRPVKIGYVVPKTGPLGAFAEADDYILSAVRASLAGGLKVGGKVRPVEIIVKDSQSNPNRAAEVAGELIMKDKIDLMVVSSTPETTNPVGDQCEINEVPCLSTLAPWQPWFFTRGGNPATGFDWTYHFFWGLEDIIAVFSNMWNSIPTNKSIAALLPNDADGNAWGDAKLGMPTPLTKMGFKWHDPGRFQTFSDDFSAQISAFKKAQAEIVTGVVIPPDFTTFWTQARQQGFHPRAVTVGKATLFPSALEALGDTGDNLSSEVWWSPAHPFTSSLTGQSSAQLAAGYTEKTGKQWTQPLGFAHALFEVGIDILKRSAEVSPKAIRDAMAQTNLNTIVGPVAWGKGPVKNVAKTPLVGGQWRLGGGRFKYDLLVANNKTAPQIPVQTEFREIKYGKVKAH